MSLIIPIVKGYENMKLKNENKTETEWKIIKNVLLNIFRIFRKNETKLISRKISDLFDFSTKVITAKKHKNVLLIFVFVNLQKLFLHPLFTNTNTNTKQKHKT